MLLLTPITGMTWKEEGAEKENKESKVKIKKNHGQNQVRLFCQCVDYLLTL